MFAYASPSPAAGGHAQLIRQQAVPPSGPLPAHQPVWSETPVLTAIGREPSTAHQPAWAEALVTCHRCSLPCTALVHQAPLRSSHPRA
eukprot:363986-Chlamydomonas_euryale.AAC.12